MLYKIGSKSHLRLTRLPDMHSFRFPYKILRDYIAKMTFDIVVKLKCAAKEGESKRRREGKCKKKEKKINIYLPGDKS